MNKTRLISWLLGAVLLAGVAPSADADRRDRRERRDDREDRRERREDRREERREDRREERRERAERRRAYRAPPAIRAERYENRRGYVWVSGKWAWDGYDWQWQAGHHERERRGHRWRPVSYELRGDEYVAVGGDWVVMEAQSAPPAYREERWAPRAGFIWVKGHYEWRGGEWAWIPGHYERERAGYRYVEPRYEQRNGAWVTIGGTWSIN